MYWVLTMIMHFYLDAIQNALFSISVVVFAISVELQEERLKKSGYSNDHDFQKIDLQISSKTHSV